MAAKDPKRVWLAIALILLCGAYAHRAYGFSIDPSRAEVVVEPNGTAIKEYVITNTDSAPIKVKACADKWVIQEGRDATSWIRVLPAEAVIAANSSQKIRCEVTAPAGVDGEYTSSLVFRAVSATPAEGSEELVAQIRVVTYVVIKGTEKIRGEISGVKVSSTSPLKIGVTVKNSGNIHIRPKGKAGIIKLIGNGSKIREEAIIDLALNPIEAPLFPDSEGDIGPKNSDINLEPGRYKVKVNVEFSPEVILQKEMEFTVGR